MNELQVFQSTEFGSVRAVTVNGVPYFVGKDVADILGYERPAKAILDHVDEDDKDEVPIQDSIGRMQNTPVINESGLYSLILSSRMSSSKKFKRWVTSEVLPAIRKHGVYAVDELLADPDMLIAALTKLKLERDRNKALSETVAVQNQQIVEMRPKASYYDVVLNCKDLARIDYFYDYKNDIIYLNEINTLPGFTNISMYPKLWEQCGIEYSKLLDLKFINLKKYYNKTTCTSKRLILKYLLE